METVFTGKGIEITPAIRSFTENKLNKLTRMIGEVMSVHVTLGAQKYLQIVEFTVKTRNGGFSASAQTTDMYASINEALDNVVRQAQRQKQRRKSKKSRTRPSRQEAWEEPVPGEAAKEATGPAPRLRRERVPVKPLSLEEAALQIRGSERNFLVFRNAASNELNVIYRRADGEIGLIEPGA